MNNINPQIQILQEAILDLESSIIFYNQKLSKAVLPSDIANINAKIYKYTNELEDKTFKLNNLTPHQGNLEFELGANIAI